MKEKISSNTNFKDLSWFINIIHFCGLFHITNSKTEIKQNTHHVCQFIKEGTPKRRHRKQKNFKLLSWFVKRTMIEP